MKTLLEKETNVSIHLWHNDDVVTLDETGFIYQDQEKDTEYNSNTSDIVPCGDAPEDWYGKKYTYSNGEWSLNPNDPMII